MWAGVRTMFGVSNGKVAYEVKVSFIFIYILYLYLYMYVCMYAGMHACMHRDFCC